MHSPVIISLKSVKRCGVHSSSGNMPCLFVDKFSNNSNLSVNKRHKNNRYRLTHVLALIRFTNFELEQKVFLLKVSHFPQRGQLFYHWPLE